jgi:hypothetical protein
MTIVIPAATISLLALLIARSRRLVVAKNEGACGHYHNQHHDNATDASHLHLGVRDLSTFCLSVDQI